MFPERTTYSAGPITVVGAGGRETTFLLDQVSGQWKVQGSRPRWWQLRQRLQQARPRREIARQIRQRWPNE